MFVPVRARFLQTKRPNCCYECRSIIPIDTAAYEYRGQFKTDDDDIVDCVILCVSCNDDWRLVRQRATRRFGAEHPLAQFVFGSLPNRVAAIRECGLLRDKYGRTLFKRWQGMKGSVPAKIGPRIPEAETVPAPAVTIIRGAPEKPSYRAPCIDTRQGQAAAAAFNEEWQERKLAERFRAPLASPSQDVTTLDESALFVLFTENLLDTELGPNETLRFNRSEARRELVRRLTPALLESILAYLEEYPPQRTAARRGWGNLLSNLQDLQDPNCQTAPESFDDVAGWTAWAQSYLQRRCATA